MVESVEVEVSSVGNRSYLHPSESWTLNRRFGFRGAQHGLPALSRIIRREREKDERARGGEKTSHRREYGRKQRSSGRATEPTCKMNGSSTTEAGVIYLILTRRP